MSRLLLPGVLSQEAAPVDVVYKVFGTNDSSEYRGSQNLPASATWECFVRMSIQSLVSYVVPASLGNWATGAGLLFYSNGTLRVFSKGVSLGGQASGISLDTIFDVHFGNDGTSTFANINGVRKYTDSTQSQSGSVSGSMYFGRTNLTSRPFTIYTGSFWINGVERWTVG